MSEAESAIYYSNVYVNDNLTIDGVDRGLTNSDSIVIGASATHPVTITVTNGARWIVKGRQTMTFDGKGGTIVVSSPTAPDFTTWASQVPLPIGTVYTNALGTVGYETYVTISSSATADGGVMDIARLLPNGTVAFKSVSNPNPNVAARMLFEGGAHWVQNLGGDRFIVSNNARIILESVGGNPISICSLAQDNTLFKGSGTLETRGDGDFVLQFRQTGWTLRTTTLSKDSGGEIAWGHKGRTLLKGNATWKIGTDNILPYGPGTGPIVFSCPYEIKNTHAPSMLDLNGKTVRVNGIMREGRYSDYSMVTNSAASTAKLIVGTNDVDGVLNGLFCAGIEIEKVGGGMLVISNAIVKGTMTVKAGSVKFIGENSFDSPVVFEDGAVLEWGGENANDSIRRFARTGDASVPLVGSPREVCAKRGSGTLDAYAGAHLDGANIAVEEGVLRFTGTTSDKWWRLTVRKALNHSVLPGTIDQNNYYDFNAFALWTTNVATSYRASKGRMQWSSYGTGRMLTYGLTTNSTEFTSAMTSYSQLPAGTCMLGFGESCKEYYMPSSGKAFTGGADAIFGYSDVVSLQSAGPTLRGWDESSWQHVIWRLPDGVPDAAGYGLCRTAWSACPWSWKLESSADGENWTLRDDHEAEVNVDAMTEGLTVEESSALSDFPLCANSMKNKANTTMWYNNGVPYRFTKGAAAAERLSGVTVEVANGATLDTDYIPDASLSIAGLRVDCANGGGTVTKFRPAANGTLELTGIVGEMPVQYVVPVTLSEVLDGDNFASWRVTVNGKRLANTRLSWSNGVLEAVNVQGFMLLFR